MRKEALITGLLGGLVWALVGIGTGYFLRDEISWAEPLVGGLAFGFALGVLTDWRVRKRRG